MAGKQQTRKRRVADAERADRQRAAAAKRERRRRLMVGGVVGFLALALIAPLTAGLIANDDPADDTRPTTTTLPPLPPWVPEELAGATLTGPTPCPATDGTAERTTGFAEAPPVCIDADATFDLRFATAAGAFTLPVDAGLDLTGANLAAVFAGYRAYEGVSVESFEGLLFVGGGDDTGFTIPVLEPPAGDDPYPVGSVVAVSSGRGIDGSLMVVLDEAGATLLAATGPHVVIGTVDDLEPLRELAADPLLAGAVRVEGVRLEPTG